MGKRIKILLVFILIFGGLIFLRLSINKKPTGEKRPAKQVVLEKVTVKVAVVKKEDLNLILSYVGSIKAKDEIEVFSKVTGKLVEYKVNEGDSVEKGQAIALIDRDETGLKFELAPVESPISGIVGKTILDKGDSVLPSASIIHGTPLAIVMNMDEMIVKLNISELDIPYVNKNLEAQIKVDAYPEANFAGLISKVSEVVDPETRTLPIEITIPNGEHRLKSGMFARIKIIAMQLKDKLVLAQDALVQEQGANYVFVVKGHTAIKKKVFLGVREDSRIEISEGLEEGEQVIVFGQQGLKDGASVEAVQE